MDQQIEKAVDAQIGKVEVFSPDIEGAFGIPRSQGDRKGKALAALDHFEAVKIQDLPIRMVEAVRIAFRTSEEIASS